MSEPEIQYWDSMLFIYLITNSRPERTKAVEHLWSRALEGKAEIRMSYLGLSEVRPKQEFRDAYDDITKRFLEADWPFFKWSAVTRAIAREARDLTLDYPLLCNPDAIHVATALQAEADVFFTFDGLKDKALRRTRGLLGMNPIRGLPIIAPTADYGEEKLPLFEASGIEAPARVPLHGK